MSIKNACTVALLLFVAASIVVLTVKSLRQTPRTAEAGIEPGGTAFSTPEDGSPPASALQPNRLVAYYFHGKVRCPTCKNIEAYAHEAVTSGFTEQLKDGRIEWRVVDYERPGNEHYAAQYELAAPSVVLVELRGGRQKNWKNLPEVWELVGDKSAFVTFVQKEVRAMLDQAGKNEGGLKR